MEEREILFFAPMPDMLPVYEVIRQKILAAFGDVGIKVDKTQISFRTKYGFAFVSLPFRRMKGWPKVCLLLSFGLDHEVKSPRIAVASQPRENRWTHHIVVARPDEVDDEVMDWLRQAHTFSLR